MVNSFNEKSNYNAKQSVTRRPTVPAWPDSTIEMAVISASCLS